MNCHNLARYKYTIQRSRKIKTMDASHVKWEGVDFYKWANVTMQSPAAHFHLSPAAEACPVCLHMPSFQGGCSGFGLVLLFSLHTGMALATFDGWLNTKTLGWSLWGSRETVSLPSFCVAVSRQWWTDRWSSRPRQLWGPSREVVIG